MLRVGAFPGTVRSFARCRRAAGEGAWRADFEVTAPASQPVPRRGREARRRLPRRRHRACTRSSSPTVVTVSEADRLSVTVSPDLGVAEPDNLAWRAAERFAEASACRRTSRCGRQGVPHGAGLGGGSSDAAAVIAALCRLNDVPRPTRRRERRAVDRRGRAVLPRGRRRAHGRSRRRARSARSPRSACPSRSSSPRHPSPPPRRTASSTATPFRRETPVGSSRVSRRGISIARRVANNLEPPRWRWYPSLRTR